MANGNKPARRTDVKRINLALQGGGSHGAFTWGVLDRLLADERIEIEAVTGASAGAMNAVVLADGLSTGSRHKARAVLRRFWEGVAEAAELSPLRRTPFEVASGSWNVDNSPVYMFLDLVSRMASPYQTNPLNWHPLRSLIGRLVDFDAVRRCTWIDVFISATNVETGRPKIFRKRELTVDHVLASGCLPYLFHAIVINGVPYWDGGYLGNPSLWPLFDHAESDDVVLVQINPFKRPGEPRQARDIINRLDEIAFNSSLLQELRAVNFVARLIDAGRLEGTGYRRVLMHCIEDEKTMAALGASSKLNAEKPFLTMLFETGTRAAERWLAAHFDDIGVRPSLDIPALLKGDEDALDGAALERKPLERNGHGLRKHRMRK